MINFLQGTYRKAFSFFFISICSQNIDSCNGYIAPKRSDGRYSGRHHIIAPYYLYCVSPTIAVTLWEPHNFFWFSHFQGRIRCNFLRQCAVLEQFSSLVPNTAVLNFPLLALRLWAFLDSYSSCCNCMWHTTWNFPFASVQISNLTSSPLQSSCLTSNSAVCTLLFFPRWYVNWEHLLFQQRLLLLCFIIVFLSYKCSKIICHCFLLCSTVNKSLAESQAIILERPSTSVTFQYCCCPTAAFQKKSVHLSILFCRCKFYILKCMGAS